MNLNKANSYFYFVVLSLLFILLTTMSYSSLYNGLLILNFNMDYLFFVLCLLVLFITSLIVLFFFNVFGGTQYFLIGSCIFSVYCFCINNFLLFWVSYELSIIFLLFLIYSDSPYTDRFLAGWYLFAYSFLCGLPLLVLLFYCGNDSVLVFDNNISFKIDSFSGLLLCLIFIAKIPLVPFHTWLPIVHAEASTVVSICLSGYIMKLGLVGIVRFCLNVLDSNFVLSYMVFAFIGCLLQFFRSIEEFDFKRWLAMLSVAHIGVSVVCLLTNAQSGIEKSLLFGLGHGISAGYFFLLIMVLGVIGGGRNSSMLSVINSWSISNVWLLLIGFCLVASFPPVVNFFIEVWLLSAFNNTFMWVVLLSIYLFFSSLIPLSLLGYGLTRRFGSYILCVNESYLVSFCLLFFYTVLLPL
uniref:NADH-ubiquinone oxidoreductase chain 4 n=1 Tax=Polylabroides guangdongensis TaxID=1131911 RepID=A0A3G0WMM6_9PLAT|nr:NADH dehydrogenase subunit 4 [Polylabroides guangdongensis]